MIFALLSGCALSTIKPAKKKAVEPEPVRRTSIVERVFKPTPKIEEKEEIMPVVREEKEEIMPVVREEKEEVLRVIEEEEYK